MKKLQELFKRQSKRVYQIAMLYLKNTSDAEDAVQSVFLKCVEKKCVFENQNHEDAWFITVTRNHCKDVLKAFWRRKVEVQSEVDLRNQDQGTLNLTEKLLLLSRKHREVIYLYYYEEYSIREISQILKRKESTIQSQLSSARKKLQREIKKGDELRG